MKQYILKISIVVVALICFSACHKRLDRYPANFQTPDETYSSELGYKRVLARVYGSMVLTSQNAPATSGFGNGDVRGVDEGFSDFFRNYWTAQEMSTDMAKWIYNDDGLYDMQFNQWNAGNPLVEGLYGRCMLVITFANELLRQSTPEKLSERGINASAIKPMRAEARFIRAYMYWVLLDLYGNPSMVTENDPINNSFLPPRITRDKLFEWIEKELTEIDADLLAPRTNEYGRADKAAAWAILSRMYLNAGIYLDKPLNDPTIIPYYTKAIANSKKVIDAGYSLMNNYQWLFMADNHVGNTEAIWTLNYDGLQSQSYGGATFIINGTGSGDRAPLVQLNGLGGWGAMRTTEKIPMLFPDFTGTIDKRALWYTDGQTLNMDEFNTYRFGFPCTKYRNRTRSGGFGNDPGRQFSDIDIPVSRLAEMYLIYAEAVKRGGTGGTEAQAIIYLNLLRTRAYQNNLGNISSYDLNYILDERARELYWEGYRRMDLIRYGRYSEASYLWPYKGGRTFRNGTAFESFRKLLPIPSKQLAVNFNLKQNPGY
jgi:starch-binding outer membrane protein, SusD/RagB family